MSLRLGEIQKLEIVKKVEFGVYLAEPGREDDKVLLPIKQVPAGASVGDVMEVFLYKDSKDRLIATTKRPKLIMGEAVLLTVAQMGKIGAFLDWGLEKDLLLPFREQTRKVAQGEEIPVALYLDKSDRLCATMKIYHYLETGAPYEKDDRVNGTVYEVSGNFGTFVAVDDRYSALIPKNELFHPIPIGAKISCRVVKKTEDGKLTLSAREKTAVQMDADARLVYLTLRSAGGFLPFHDKSSPEDIKARFGLSKAAFKRAIGALYKARKITISEKGISDAGDDSEV